MRVHPAWRSPLHAIRDRISFSTNAAKVRAPSISVLDGLQFHPPEVQMDALFAVAVAMSDAIGVDPHAMVSRAKRMLPDLEGAYTMHLQAARDYARGELKR